MFLTCSAPLSPLLPPHTNNTPESGLWPLPPPPSLTPSLPPSLTPYLPAVLLLSLLLSPLLPPHRYNTHASGRWLPAART